MSPREAELLDEIRKDLPGIDWERYYELVSRRQQAVIGEAEFWELSNLTDRLETLNVDRIRRLVELADLRGVPLPELMDQLEIQPPPVI